MTPPAAPALGLPIVYLVDDEDVVRDALGWLLRSRRLLSEGFVSAEAIETMIDAKSPQALADWPSAPSWLCWTCACVSQPTVSHHLAILRDADLVLARSEGKQTYYMLNQERIAVCCGQLLQVFAPEAK